MDAAKPGCGDFTDVYVREGGEWRLFASHMTPLRRTAGFHA